MRNRLVSALLMSLVVACGATDATNINGLADGSADSATCSGTPPVTCDGCCGSKYAADHCSNGVWTCQPRGIACIVCDDAGTTDEAASDASGDATTCTGTPPVICDGCCGSKYAADQCSNGAWTCRPRGIALCIVCDAAAPDSAANDASSDGGACTGTPPSCFGNDTSMCCGNDPSGMAVCIGGAWMCGSSRAPGCNGTSCVLGHGPG